MITLAGSTKTKMITRAEWGARRPRYVTKFTPSFGTTLHWEGPKMGTFSHEACYSYVRGIQNYHMDAKGWSDIAYTCVVCPHGYVFEGRWIGNRTGANGTNTGNGTAYAICYLGGQGDPFTDAADRAIHDTTTHLRRHGRAGRGVNCHRDWKPTQCPGDVICKRVKAGRYSSDAASPAPTPQPSPKPSPEEEDMPKPLLVRLSSKDPAVLYMSADRKVHWVSNAAALAGYKEDMKNNGYSDAVCVLNTTSLKNLRNFIINLPFLGDWPTLNGKSTGVKEAWTGPHFKDEGK